jgi:hypothetical protein
MKPMFMVAKSLASVTVLDGGATDWRQVVLPYRRRVSDVTGLVNAIKKQLGLK